MYRVMVKHAGSNSDAHVVEHCQVESLESANQIVRLLGDEKMPSYELSPKLVKRPRRKMVPRYTRVYCEKVPSSPPVFHPTGPVGIDATEQPS